MLYYTIYTIIYYNGILYYAILRGPQPASDGIKHAPTSTCTDE